MKSKIWNKPPRYRGYQDNRQILTVFATMAQGLAMISDDNAIAERLTVLQMKLEYRRTDKSHADIRFFVTSVFDDFLDVREAMAAKDALEVESALLPLETDVEKIANLIRDNVAITPWTNETDHRVAKLIENIANIRSIFQHASDDYRKIRKKYEEVSFNLQTANLTDADRERIATRERRLHAYCAMREKIVNSLGKVLDELDEIKVLAHDYPALAARVNRRIKIHRLADFYIHPLKAQAEREKLYAELLYIIHSVDRGDEISSDWEEIVYGEKKTPTSSSFVDLTEGLFSQTEEATKKNSRGTTAAQTDLADGSGTGANNYRKEGE